MFKLSFKQQVLAGFAISLIFVLISAVTSYYSVKSLNESNFWQTHTYQVINLTQRIETELLNTETGLRGFVITQKHSYIDPYSKNSTKIIPSIHELKKLVHDRPEQVARVDSLEFYATKKILDMQEILQANSISGKDQAVTRMMTDRGKFFKDQMLHISENIIDLEMKLLKERQVTAAEKSSQTIAIVLVSALIIFCLILFLSSYIKRTFDEQKSTELRIRESNEELEKVSAENEAKNWMLSGASAINESLRGEQEVDELCNHVVSRMCSYLNARVGSLYLFNRKTNSLVLTGTYAYEHKKGKSKEISLGEGLVGQAAIEKQIIQLNDLPADYIKVSSSLGNTPPNTLIVLPVLFENEIIAVMEIGLSKQPTAMELDFFTRIAVNIGIGINSAMARAQLRDLFTQTQQQAEELESQQEELRTTNEELVYKSEQLQASEEELRVQQEELRQTNAELEEKAQQLEERNLSINEAKEAISMKAEELEISSKYKSEFLANMSHELRTPLNSILILARILKENKPENLTEDQIKYAGVIHNAGSDLLTLINDILDLSKIESGTIDLHIEPVRPEELTKNMDLLFREIARSKKIEFTTVLAENLPATIDTDLARIEQVIKNLLSNAFKFTPEHGLITLQIGKAKLNQRWYSEQLQNFTNDIISISVKDSGIGIPEDKQKLIFEAFQQADGSTSRKYGGTGLGLSISKELAYILGGEIQVESVPGEGSTFTLFVPAKQELQDKSLPEEAEILGHNFIAQIPAEALPVQQTRSDAELTLLIVEDDLNFAEVLKDYATQKGFKAIIALSGDVGLKMAEEQIPDAIVLDVMLPVMDGWTILKKLKSNPNTKHIPVHMMSAGDEKTSRAQQEGAIGFLKKPIEKEELDQAFDLLSAAHIKYNFKTVLLIEDQELQSQLVKEQLTEKGVEVTQAFNGDEALKILQTQRFDCIILDLNLPDISGFDLLDQIKSQPALTHIPVIINTAMELDQAKIAHIMQYTEAMVLKSNKSNDRLIDEVSLFMNKLKQEGQSTTATTQKMASTSIEKVLKDKTVLITDDDMRNIFALSSALQAYEINIVIANNGREAIEKLDEVNHIDLVLMDIMMPEMDGYEAMRHIRLKKEFAKLPIIALTAKAMKNDREKCIEAGANDYISKPVDVDQLLSMMRVWLS
ncbi:response regulator [Pedobacter sp. MC2016-14]|uniref:response regulator n=1 Tax=Pedobacter sp. MC2016-14 TaxID=2897327 RepID=UPI001E38B819|nr:response regulator [Pedobacter sp. MC2016-14]MCD0487983.1 response regulator [Pedobacter sp. MC2016-14]